MDYPKLSQAFRWNSSVSIHLPAALISIAILTASAHGQSMSETDKCLQSIKDARVNLTKTEDTGRPGEKVEKEALELIPIATRLCQDGKFTDAEKLVGYLRHLLAD